MQDVAFGTRIAKLECSDHFLLPNWIRKSHRAKLMRAFVAEFQEIIPKMPSCSWMYDTMDQKRKEAMRGLISMTNAIAVQFRRVIPERL